MPTKKKSVLVVDDSEHDRLRAVFARFSDSFDCTLIVGAEELLPGQIRGILPDGTAQLLNLSDFQAASVVMNHVKGSIGPRALVSHLRAHHIQCMELGCPDGRSERQD